MPFIKSGLIHNTQSAAIVELFNANCEFSEKYFLKLCLMYGQNNLSSESTIK